MKKTSFNRPGTVVVSIFMIAFLFMSSAAVSASTAIGGPTAGQIGLTEDYPYTLYLPVVNRLPNPVPTLTTLSPTTTMAEGIDFILTVNGTDFISNSVVYWNGSPRTTTLVSITQLTAAISAADIASAGSYPVTVVTPAPGGGTSNAISFPVTNPVPTLATLSPPSTNAGGGDFILTVNGANFVAGSVVNWNGSPRATTFVSSMQLNAAISAADISSAGSYAVTVFNPAPGGGTSGAVNFTVAVPGYSLRNGDFEAGGADWTQYSTHGWSIIDTTFPGSITAHGGSYAAWMGGEYDDTSSVTQTNVSLAGVRYLHFWYWIASVDACGYDFARVKVNGAQIDEIQLCTDTNTGGWVQKVLDLNSYAGATITLQFEVTTDSSGNSNFILDDISITGSAIVQSGIVNPAVLEASPLDIRTAPAAEIHKP
jgi:hypothetical protein